MVRCPYCKNEDKTIHNSVVVNSDKLRMKVYCFRCEKRWTEVYVFLHIEEDKEISDVGQSGILSNGEQTRHR